MKGRIFAFQSMGAVDGPGLRCVIFMQGCPLRCSYCHNPESWDKSGGEEADVSELVQKTERFGAYIERGGVTASGGEPLMQADFTAALFEELRSRGYHTALDTSGAFGASEAARRVLRHTDLAICDLKFNAEGEYGKYCGGSLSKVLDFLSAAGSADVPIWIRRVIIPGLNDGEKDVEEMIKICSRFSNVEKIELLPFKKMCEAKYRKLGIDFPMKSYKECGSEKIKELQSMADEIFSRGKP